MKLKIVKGNTQKVCKKSVRKASLQVPHTHATYELFPRPQKHSDCSIWTVLRFTKHNTSGHVQIVCDLISLEVIGYKEQGSGKKIKFHFGKVG